MFVVADVVGTIATAVGGTVALGVRFQAAPRHQVPAATVRVAIVAGAGAGAGVPDMMAKAIIGIPVVTELRLVC